MHACDVTAHRGDHAHASEHLGGVLGAKMFDFGLCVAWLQDDDVATGIADAPRHDSDTTPTLISFIVSSPFPPYSQAQRPATRFCQLRWDRLSPRTPTPTPTTTTTTTPDPHLTPRHLPLRLLHPPLARPRPDSTLPRLPGSPTLSRVPLPI